MFELNSKSAARWAVAFVFLYHGLVPKLLRVHPSEIELVSATPTMGIDPALLVRLAGVAEVVLALIVVVFWHRKWPLYLAALALAFLMVATLVFVPAISVAAFNPVSLTVTTLVLVWIALRPNETGTLTSD
ncbi:MAG: DoxX-like family protein [Myxococcota bacterium]|nr:DoxX-like family protein [Myxococcota bacterium]